MPTPLPVTMAEDPQARAYNAYLVCKEVQFSYSAHKAHCGVRGRAECEQCDFLRRELENAHECMAILVRKAREREQ